MLGKANLHPLAFTQSNLRHPSLTPNSHRAPHRTLSYPQKAEHAYQTGVRSVRAKQKIVLYAKRGRKERVGMKGCLWAFKIEGVDFLGAHVAQQQQRTIGRDAAPGDSREDHASKPS